MHVCNKKMVFLRLIFLVLAVFMANTLFAADSKTGHLINCDIQNQPCNQTISGGHITFDIQPKPVKAMEDLMFEVKLKDIDLTGPPVIDLGMPGMKMGPNQVTLKMTDTGVFQGKGIIVRCPSGKTIWQATVNIPGKGSVDFIFDVVY